MSEHVRPLNSDNWDREVLQSDVPVLVDFSATWCPPCRLIEPTIEKLAAEFVGRARVGSIDVDRHPEIAERYGVNAMPTLLVFQGGKVVDQRIGAGSEPVLRGFLEAHIVAAPAR